MAPQNNSVNQILERYQCSNCEKSYSRRYSLKRHQNIQHANSTKISCASNNDNRKSNEKPKTKNDEDGVKKNVDNLTLSFLIQFIPELDKRILQVNNRLWIGKESQKFILEYYLAQYNWTKMNVSKLEVKFAYITPENQKRFKKIELLNVRPQEDKWYEENIIEPIFKEMKNVEEEGNIVKHMCYIKGFSANPPFLIENCSRHIKLSNRLYSINENGDLTCIETK